MTNIKELQKQVKRKSLWQIYGILTLSSLLIAICLEYIILPAKILAPGLGGIATGINLIILSVTDNPIFINNQTMIYFIIYIPINIPIFIMMWKLYGENFSSRTVYYLMTNIIFSMVIEYTALGDLTIIPDLVDAPNKATLETVRIIILSLIGGLIYGLGLGVAFKVGGSTGGLDPVARYLSRDKGINIKNVLFTISITISLVFVIILYSIGPKVEDQKFINFIQETIFSPIMIGTLIFAFSHSFIASKIFSSSSKKEITVTSKKVPEMSRHFNKIGFHRNHTILEVEGGYSQEKILMLTMVINGEEIVDIIEDLAAIDKSAFIVIKDVSKIYDLHDWRPNTKDDKMIRDKKEFEKERKNLKHKK